MLGYCSACGASIMRYWENTYKNPCAYCGSVIFRLIHLGLPYPYTLPQHEIYYNVETEELLSPDLCTDYFSRGEDEVTEVY